MNLAPNSFIMKKSTFDICWVDDCNNLAVSGKRNGFPLCSLHAHRKRKYGFPTGGQKIVRGTSLKWIDNLLKEKNDGLCRDWPFGLTKENGYPSVRKGSRNNNCNVSHIILEKTGYPRPNPPFNNALHSCDRPICVAPWHLRWGSKRENYQDSVDRDRNCKGESHGNSKLSEKDIISMRSMYSTGRFTYKEIGFLFGVEGITANRIINKESWKHIIQ